MYHPHCHVGVSMSLLTQFKVTFESIRDLLLEGGGSGTIDSTEVTEYMYFVMIDLYTLLYINASYYVYVHIISYITEAE